jgi:hypothetical protein
MKPCLAAAGVGLATLFLTTAALAQAVPARGSPRDISGLWDTTQGLIFDPASTEPKGVNVAGPTTREHPPYNAEWEAKYDKTLKYHREVDIVDPLNFCQPPGFPRALGGLPGPIEIVQTPTMTYLTWEYMSSIHRVYMNQPHPAENELWPMVMGNAVGHWEGDTLVVDTVSMKEGVFDRTGAPYSDKVHVVERITKTDPNHITDDITIEDPTAFTKPWHVVRKWQRADPETRIGDLYCDSDRNPVVDGKVQVVLDAPVVAPGSPEHDELARKAAAETAAAERAKTAK